MLNYLEAVYRKRFPKRLKSRHAYRTMVRHKTGLEIGGPSAIFDAKGILPLYPYAKRVDGCNYHAYTVWEGHLNEGYNYHVSEDVGYQYLTECTDLSAIKDETYDFILSCHNLEHVANPLKALDEWKRVMKKSGCFILILPHKDKTFDHRRPVTTLDHVKQDFLQNIGEDDDTHFEEILKLHDCQKEVPVADIETLKERLSNNLQNRCAHHHVFNAYFTAELLNYAGFRILDLSVLFHNIIVLADLHPDLSGNSSFLSGSHPVYNDPRYPSDYVNVDER